MAALDARLGLKDLLNSAKLINGRGETISMSEATEGKKALALHFSGPSVKCQHFTAMLAEWYEKDLSAKGLGVIFVFLGSDELWFKDYCARQPWLALDLAEQDTKEKLSATFGLSGRPALVILGADLETITTNGRAAVSADPEGLEMPWYPKPVSNLKEEGRWDTYEMPMLLLFCETSDASEQKALEAMITPLAEKVKRQAKATSSNPEFVFMMVTEAGSRAEQLREYLGLPGVMSGKTQDPQLVLMDIPDDFGCYIGATSKNLTAEMVEKFLVDYRTGGKLERKQMS